VLRKTFGRKKEEVIGGWRKAHNEELSNSKYSPYTRIMRRIWAVAWEEERYACRDLLGKPEEPLRIFA
jgi:hypothetical protein